MATTEQRLAAAMAAAERGLRIVILEDHNGTPRYRKKPVGKDWGLKATDDEESLIRRFENRPNANIGVLLGKYPVGSKITGVIDVEFDCDEGRITAERLFGNNTFTPTYKSARSVHRLFLWNDAFPPEQKLAIEGLEVRLGGGAKQTQSVLPPSTHEDGREYQWLPGLSIDEVELAEVPEILAVQFCNVESRLEAEGLSSAASGGQRKPDEYWESLKDGVAKGSRNEALCSLVGRWLTNQVEIDAAELKDRAVDWGKRCDPPLPAHECEQVVKSVVGRERKRRAAEADSQAEQVAVAVATPSAQPTNRVFGDTPQPSEKSERGSLASIGIDKVQIVESKPPMVILYSKSFVDSANHSITMPLVDLPNIRIVQNHSLEQSQSMLPGSWQRRGAWTKICAKLIANADKVQPDPELNRPSIIARLIIRYAGRSTGCLSQTAVRENGISNPTGIEQLDDGRWVISVQAFYRYLCDERALERVTREEVLRVIRSIDAVHVNWAGRYWVVDDLAKQKLNSIEGCGS